MAFDNNDALPIAVVGIGCRFPGDASDPQAFWQMLVEGRNARGLVPKSRYNVDAYYHPDRTRSGTTAAREAHFLSEDVNRFDAPFFSISPMEAKAMDPQQRILLEVTYEALENAGLSADNVQGSNTSCFIGAFTTDFRDNLLQDIQSTTEYTAAGCSNALTSNRISWFYDLRGPSMTIDTACSSSLSAFHLACQSLRSGECHTAIVGGSSLMLGPSSAVILSAGHLLSPDGISYAFDHRANGYSRGEGVGIVIIKRLHDALRDDNIIRSVVRSTGCNQDGRTFGVSQPSIAAQEALIRATYQKAGLNPAETGYVEAHGTGTKVGDPIEMAAIGRAFGDGRCSSLFVGSVKSSIGHLEGAAGMASIIKCIYAVETGLIPPSLRFEKLNPDITLSEYIQVPTRLEAWPIPGARRASINSFGFGGSNAHIIIEDALHFLESHNLSGNHGAIRTPQLDAPPAHLVCGSQPVSNSILHTVCPRRMLFPFSSHDEKGVGRYVVRLLRYIQTKRATVLDNKAVVPFLEALASTLARHRRHSWKSFVTASTLNELVQSLQNIPKAVRSSQRSLIAFIFTGQGAQWWAMGRELSAYAVYRDSIHASGQHIHECGSTWDLEEELGKAAPNSRLQDPCIGQPACTAIQIALVHLLESFGIEPVAVVGHSSGEVAAAYTAGAISHAYAIKIAWYRGYYASSLCSGGRKGAMIAINAGCKEIEGYMKKLKHGEAVIACINSTKNCTVSGDIGAIDELQIILGEENVVATRLNVDVAYHSPHMKDISQQYLDAILSSPGVEPRPRRLTPIQMISSLTGSLISPDDLDASYWVQNLVSPVNFCDAMRSLLQHLQNRDELRSDKGLTVRLVEIGPHSALRTPVMDSVMAASTSVERVQYSTLLRRDHPADFTLLQAMGELYQSGSPLSFAEIGQVLEPGARLIDLPGYAWNHSKSYDNESPVSNRYRFPCHSRHDLLGIPVSGSGGSCWRNVVRARESPWVQGYKINSSIIYPCTGYLSMAIEAARRINTSREMVIAYELSDISFMSALKIPQDEVSVEILIEARPSFFGTESTSSRIEFRISSASQDEEHRELHCTGIVRAIYASPGSEAADENIYHGHDYIVTANACITPVNSFYQRLKASGVEHGDNFQNLLDLYADQSHARGCICVPDTASLMPSGFESDHLIHPVTLDTFIQLGFLAVVGPTNSISETMAPKSIRRLWIATSPAFRTPGLRLAGCSSSQQVGVSSWEASICIANQDKQELFVEGLQICSLPGEKKSFQDTKDNRQLCSELIWVPDIDFLPTSKLRTLIFKANSQDADEEDLLAKLEQYLDLYLPTILGKWKALDEEPKVSGHFLLWLEWLVQRVERVTEHTDVSDVEMARASLAYGLRKSPTGSVWLQVTELMGENFIRIMRGEVEPLQLLLKGDLLFKLYRDGFGISGNNNIAKYVNLISTKCPSMTFLEIGAGTGATASHVLEQLGQQASSYTFTDISSGFLGAAADKLARHASIMNFKTLDIEREPIHQGFQTESFDIIIAANVLHATSKIARALAHVKKLLRPGGKLLLLELTTTLTAVTLIMGSLPGWWLGESDGRKGGPLLSVEQWDRILKDAGFTGVDLDMRGRSTSSSHPVSFMVSTKQVRAPKESKALAKKITIVTKPSEANSPLSKDLQQRLAMRGVYASNCLFGSPVPDGDFCIVLLEDSEPLLSQISDHDFRSLQELIRNSSGMVWITRGAMVEYSSPHRSLVLGVARSVRNEHAGYPMGILDLDLAGEGPRVSKAIVDVALKVAFDRDAEYEYALRLGQILIPRVLSHPDLSRSITENKFYAGYSIPLLAHQDGDSTPMTKPSVDLPLHPDWVEVEVEAVGLNRGSLGFIVSEASGVLTQLGSNVHGYACGHRVMAAFLKGETTIQQSVRLPAATLLRIPDNMDAETAASLPFSYLTTYYALVTIAGLKAGERVLINTQSNSMCWAAVRIATALDAVVYVATRSDEERDILYMQYGIPQHRIISHGASSLARSIMRVTNEQGIDLILGSLENDNHTQAWKCIARFGRFVTIEETASHANLNITSGHSQSIIFVNPDDVLKYICSRTTDLVHGVQKLLDQGLLQATAPPCVYSLSDFPDALRSFELGACEDKIVVSKRRDLGSNKQLLGAKPIANATYMIAGLGGVGRNLGWWLAQQGARNFIFVSRSAATGPQNLDWIAQLKETFSITALAFDCDIADQGALRDVLAQCSGNMPPIRGVITGAMELQDGLFEKMTPDAFRAAVLPKVDGSWNLHKLLPANMDFFIMLSSIIGVTGLRGQANYNAGNAFQDALAYYRVNNGLCATSLDLGYIPRVGFVAKNDDFIRTFLAIGIQRIEPHEVHALIAMAMQGGNSGLPPQIITCLPADGSKGSYYWAHDAKFSLLKAHRSLVTQTESASVSLQRKLSNVADTETMVALVEETLVKKIARLMMIAPDDVEVSKSLSAYGVDSLIAAEVRNWIAKEMSVDMSTFDILENTSISEIVELLVSESQKGKDKI